MDVYRYRYDHHRAHHDHHDHHDHRGHHRESFEYVASFVSLHHSLVQPLLLQVMLMLVLVALVTSLHVVIWCASQPTLQWLVLIPISPSNRAIQLRPMHPLVMALPLIQCW